MLSLVRHHDGETPVPQPLLLAPQDAVRGEHDLTRRQVVEVPATSVETAHRHGRGEAAQLPLPVPEERGRADDEGRPGVVPSRSQQVECDDLDRLAEAHVVSEAGAEAELGHLVEPGHPAQLVRAQLGMQADRLLHRGQAPRSDLAEP